MMDSGNGAMLTMPVEPAGSGNNNGGGFGWGGDGAFWIIILFLFAFCGWGGGYGGFGGGGANSPGLQGLVTRADINEGFAMNNLQSGINAIQQGICDATYALTNTMNSGFNTMQMGMMQGFNGVQAQICNLGAQLAQCCCDIRASVQDVKYEMAQSTCNITNQMNSNARDVIENQNNNARALLDKLCQMEYNGLNDKYQAAMAENQALRFAASQTAQNSFIAANQSAQTAEIIRRLGADCPTPAYVVQPPTPVNFPTNCCGQFTGWGNGCNQCGNC